MRKLKTLVGIVICGLAVGVAGILIIRPFFTTHLDLNSAVVTTKNLLIKAGGSEKVCAEADEIFRRYGTTEQIFFTANLLKDYPAMTSLGNVDYIMPDAPSYIKIRVGTHFNGFMIKILDGGARQEFVGGAHTSEIVKGRIYINL